MSGIELTNETWNPIRGCSRVSKGCRHCYAETLAGRFCGPGQPYEGLVKTVMRDVRQVGIEVSNGAETGKNYRFRTIQRREARWTGEVRFVAERLADPLKWKKPRRIFVNSMSDLFHESLTNEQIAAVFGVMAAAPQHTFQVLTKRAKRMREWFEWVVGSAAIDGVSPSRFCFALAQARGVGKRPRCVVDAAHVASWPLSSVCLGVSVENQAAADERIPELLRTPAALRFLSCEPLLGSIDIQPWTQRVSRCTEDDPCAACQGVAGVLCRMSSNLPRIDWAIAGCESGAGARRCEAGWLRSLRDQCAAASVPFFLKQAQEQIELIEGVGRTFPHSPIHAGPGSSRKPGGIIGLPYLDGVQHAAFPEARP